MCTLHKDRQPYIRQYYDEFFLERVTFQNQVAYKIKKGNICLNILFSENFVFYEIV